MKAPPATLQQLQTWTNLLLGRLPLQTKSQHRYRRILHTLVAALFGRGISVIVSLISIPLTLHYLGVERYGVWVVLNTFFIWLALADLGVGNSLINRLAGAYSRNDLGQARKEVASAFWLTVGLALLLAVVFLVVWPALDWPDLFRVRSPLARQEVGVAVALSALIFLLNIPLSLVQKIYYAYQEGYIYNYWASAGSVLGLVGLLWVTATERGLVWLVVAVPGAALLVTLLNALYLFGWHKPWLRPSPAAVDRQMAQLLIATGGWFFVLTVESIIINQVDNLVIMRQVGIEAVTPYSVTFRLFNLLMLPIATVSSALWAAYAEAQVGDPAWVGRTFRRSLALGGAYGVAAAVGLILVARPFIGWWAGPEALPDFALVAVMALWSLTTPIGYFFSVLLNGLSEIRVQVAAGGLNAVLNLLLSIWLSTHFGAAGVAAGTLIASFATWVALWPFLRRALQQTASLGSATPAQVGP